MRLQGNNAEYSSDGEMVESIESIIEVDEPRFTIESSVSIGRDSLAEQVDGLSPELVMSMLQMLNMADRDGTGCVHKDVLDLVLQINQAEADPVLVHQVHSE